MLRDETEFIGNAIGIDPRGCGCLDCLVGNSINSNDDEAMTELARQAAHESRQVVNRSESSYALVRRHDGQVELRSLLINSVFLEAEGEAAAWDRQAEKTYLHESYCSCGSCEEGDTIPAERIDDVHAATEDIINATDVVMEFVHRDDSMSVEAYLQEHPMVSEVLEVYPYS